MVVHRHGQNFLGIMLADDVVVQSGLDFLRQGNFLRRGIFLAVVVLYDVAAQGHAFVADIYFGTGHNPLDLVLSLAAKGAGQLAPVFSVRHGVSSSTSVPCGRPGPDQ